MNKQFETIVIVGIVFVLSIVAINVNASPITHEFKNPSFSGIGASAHYLTIDEQETKRRDELAEKIQAELDEIQREIDNSTLNKFLNNLQSRIFSNLSRDISDMLFSEDGGTGGTIELEGNSISFSNDGEYITLTVIDENGTITEIVIPIGVFGVCTSDDCGI
jgi:hypothetical protein|tara:strand:- start:1071 stop:1559 length:489 start_codon:yes stop_codon:yes gene_type:complete